MQKAQADRRSVILRVKLYSSFTGMNLPRRICLARTFSNFFSDPQNSLVSISQHTVPRRQALADQRERILPLLHLGRVARVMVRWMAEEEGVLQDGQGRLLEGLTLK